MIDYAALEDWAVMAAQELQDICDEAQIACGNPDGDDQLLGVRMLLADLDAILADSGATIIRREGSAPTVGGSDA